MDSLSSEIGKVCRYLGRDKDDSDVREEHLATLLHELITHTPIEEKIFYAKMSLRCKMNRRYIRENYIDGLEAYKIVHIYLSDGRAYIEWVGLPEDAPDPRFISTPYAKAKAELAEKEEKDKPKSDKEIEAEKQRANYQLYTQSCEKSGETPLSYDAWITEKYQPEKILKKSHRKEAE